MDDNLEVPLDEREALEMIRRVGEVESISQLAALLRWERTGTGRALARWQAARLVTLEDGPRGRKIIRALAVVQAEHARAQVDNAQSAPSATTPGANAVPHDIAHAPSLPAQAPTFDAMVRWIGKAAPSRIFGCMTVALSFALYFISTFLNMTFWANLNPDATAKEILAAAGLCVEFANFILPSAVSFVPLSHRVLRLIVWGVLCLTMVVTAIASAGVVKSSLGASQVLRKQTIEQRARLESIITSVTAPVPDGVVDAQKRVAIATALRKTTCAPTRSLDIDACNAAKAEEIKAASALANENMKRVDALVSAAQQHRKDIADAEAALDRLPVISSDHDVVAAGIGAIMPGVPEEWVDRGVVVLWALLFTGAPAALLRLGLAILGITRWGVSWAM